MINIKDYDKDVQEFITRHLKLGATVHVNKEDTERLELRNNKNQVFAVLPRTKTNLEEVHKD